MDLEFYNWTSQIRYPLVHADVTPVLAPGGTDFGDDWVVDIGFLFDIDADFDPELHTVSLYRISVGVVNVNFYFASTAPGYLTPFIVSVPIASNFGLTTDFKVAGFVSGYINTGHLDTLPVVGDYTVAANFIEPANIQTLKDSYVTSIILCNDGRVTATPPAGCEEEVASSSSSSSV